jgi:hypothetical protein
VRQAPLHRVVAGPSVSVSGPGYSLGLYSILTSRAVAFVLLYPATVRPSLPRARHGGGVGGSLEQIFDGAHPRAHVHVDVAVVFEAQQLVVWHDVSVCDDPVLAAAVGCDVRPLSLVGRGPPSVQRVDVVFRPRRLVAELEREPVLTRAVVANTLCGRVGEGLLRVRL